MNAVECENLTRAFGKNRAVDQLNLKVPQGSVFALLGANGAGKTTTLKLLLNLLRPTSGRATVLGRDSARLSKQEFQRIGYVAEDLIQPDWMKLPAFLGYYRSLYRDWDHDLEKSLRVSFGLPEDRPIRKFSRGMRMKAVLLSTLSFRPELLILDEPFSGLDPMVRDDLTRGVLEMMSAEKPCTVIVSSHDIADIERLADWVGILAQGKLLAAEPLSDLQRRFRRIEIVGAGVAERVPMAPPPSWTDLRTPSPTTVQFVHHNFNETVLAELKSAFAAHVEASPLSLREIFIARASNNPSHNQE